MTAMLPATADDITRADVEDMLERWSQQNELDAWAFLTTRGIEVQDAGTGRVLATLPDLLTFEDFAANIDHEGVAA